MFEGIPIPVQIRVQSYLKRIQDMAISPHPTPDTLKHNPAIQSEISASAGIPVSCSPWFINKSHNDPGEGNTLLAAVYTTLHVH